MDNFAYQQQISVWPDAFYPPVILMQKHRFPALI